MRFKVAATALLVVGLTSVSSTKVVVAQQQETQPKDRSVQSVGEDVASPESTSPKSTSPKFLSPEPFLPKELARKVTLDLKRVTLDDFVEHFDKKLKIPMRLDSRHFELAGINGDMVVPTPPVKDQPLYLVLKQLQELDLAWYLKDGVLYVTTPEIAEAPREMRIHPVQDLLAAGYDADSLIETITSMASPTTWEEVGGPSSEIYFISRGFIVVRHTLSVQLEISGLLAGLRNHGRQTFVNEPEQNQKLRAALKQKLTVDFDTVMLSEAVAKLADLAKVDLRLSLCALDDAGLDGTEKVTVAAINQSLQNVLDEMLKPLDLTWMIHDGVLWITHPYDAETQLHLAVYDVRDLCPTTNDVYELLELLSFVEYGGWDEMGGSGAQAIPKPGVLVISHTTQVHARVLDFLEQYRAKLAEVEHVPQEPLYYAQFYKLQTAVAKDMQTVIPELVAAESWKTKEQPDAKGTIRLLTSNAEVVGDAAESAKVIEHSILLIRQTPEVHQQIQHLIRRVEHGDSFFGGAALDFPSK